MDETLREENEGRALGNIPGMDSGTVIQGQSEKFSAW